MAILVIAEKPSVARSIAAVLGATEKKDGYITGNGYIISWCFGHLVSQAAPEEYDEAYTKWSLSTLPIIPKEWKYSVNVDGAKQFNTIQTLMLDDKVTSLVCATDAGREGECIFRYVYNKVGCRKPFQRLWISSMESKAINDGFKTLKSSKEYDNLFVAGECRAKADWLVGMNFTRWFSTMYKAKPPLSIGRVQTPTLAMIVEREKAISSFVKEKYYIVNLVLSLENQNMTVEMSSSKIETEAVAIQISNACKNNGKAIVTDVVTEMKTVSPPHLYDLTTLQREANRLFGYTAQQTLDTAQSLYEKKVLTYPRTDSRFLTDDMEETATVLVDIVSQTFGELGKPYSFNSKILINNAKVNDHHALLPTVEIQREKTISSLSDNERNVLMLVCARLLCAVSDPHKYEAVSVSVQCADEKFSTKGKTILENGWKTIDDAMKAIYRNTTKDKAEEKNEDKSLPVLLEKQLLIVDDAFPVEHFTQPPKCYTEDTLLSAMETAGNENYDSSTSAEVERKGIGTSATRANVIETLVKRKLIIREKKKLIPTERGIQLISIAPIDVKSPKLTADWETFLLRIEKSEASPKEFMTSIENYVASVINKNNTPREEYKDSFSNDSGSERTVVGKCPKCGKDVVEMPKSFSCSDRECKFCIWKALGAGGAKNMTAAQAKKLLDDKKTGLIKGLKSKKGTTFDAFIVLKDDYSTEYEFPPKKK